MPRNDIRSSRPSSVRFRRVLTAGCALAIMLGAIGPAYAVAEDPSDPNAAIKAETEKTKAQTDKIKAETDKVKAQTDALGLAPAKGETTLGAGAGQMEAYMLAAAAMNQAAASIAEAVGKDAAVIVVGGDDALDLSLPIALDLQMTAVTEDANALAAAACRKAPSESASASLFAAGTLAIVGGIVNALKVDTEISGLTVETSDRAFVNAVASNLTKGVVLSEAVQARDLDSTKIYADWTKLRQARAGLLGCNNQLVRAKKTEAEAEAAAEVAAKVQASIGQIDAFASAVTKTEAGGNMLVRAAILEGVTKSNPRVLRVAAEHAGGSLIKRKNLWTMFGANGVSLTSGLVASYRLTNPDSGKVERSGLLVCRTAHTSLNAVQNGAAGVSACSHALRAGYP